MFINKVSKKNMDRTSYIWEPDYSSVLTNLKYCDIVWTASTFYADTEGTKKMG